MWSLLKRLNFRIARAVVRWLTRPEAFGLDAVDGAVPVYVLDHRSLTDLLVLDLLTERAGLPRPTEPFIADGVEEARRFFFLNRGAGIVRRHTMRSYSSRMLRFESWLLGAPGAQATLVPVSIFWGRAANKERSVVRSLFSDDWSMSSRFRRFMSLFFNRTDIVVRFGAALPWHEIVDAGLDHNRMTRRTARLLRVTFRNQRTATLGPDLSHRRTLVDRVLASRAVLAAIEEDGETDRAEALRVARRYANSIASDMSYPTMRFLNRVLTWFWNRIYDGIEVRGIDRLARLADTHTLVYAPSHRSHVDYLLLSYVLFHQGFMIPHIAAGENMNMPLAGPILRRGGAFFMRRRFLDDRLYTAIFAEYLYQVLRRGHSVEYFIEGGRSRTGRLLRPHVGLLRMTLDAARRGVTRPIAIVPVYIGYEKVIEAGSYLSELRGNTKRRESIRGLLRSSRLARQSFGKVSIDFGEPIDLAAPGADPSAAAARDLGMQTLLRINAVASVNPVNLVALTTLSMPRQAIDERLLIEQIDCLRTLLSLDAGRHGHHVTDLPADAVVAAVESLGLLERDRRRFGDILGHDRATAVLMTWYRNNVLHVFAAPSLVACLVVNRRRSARAADLTRYFETVYPFVRRELFLPEEAQDTVTRWLGHLAALGLVVEREGGLYAAPPPEAPERFRLKLLANILRETIERYYVVVAMLTANGPLTRADLESRCGVAAARMSKLHGIDAPDFSDERLFRGFIDALIERGAVTTQDGCLRAEPVVATVVRAARQVIDDEFRQGVALFAASGAGQEFSPRGPARGRTGNRKP